MPFLETALAQLQHRSPPLAAEAIQARLCAFPSWFLRIECERCRKDRVINETHAPWRDFRLGAILARMRHEGCGGRAAMAELLTGI